MKLAALTIASFLLAQDYGPGTLSYDGPPPERFIKESAAVVVFLSPAQIPLWCGPASAPDRAVIACVKRMPSGQPVVIMPHPCVAVGEYYGRILCHELGHVNGWTARHEP